MMSRRFGKTPLFRIAVLLAVSYLAQATRRGENKHDNDDNDAGILIQALYLGNVTGDTTFENCVWRKGNDEDKCPDPDIKYYFYTSDEPETRKEMDLTQNDWLRKSGWNHDRENVVIIHGYNGGDNSSHVSLLRNAYLNNGSYNVFVVDWSALGLAPCYPAAVHNIRTVARCTADMYTFLRDSGVPMQRTTCVGHSLGAHLCGAISGFIRFRMYKIIGLDPARPLIRGHNRMRPGDAEIVQIIHTNAGTLGEHGRLGLVDFCVNGGREQPHCANKTNVDLCSHIRSICYLAESINTATARLAEPCRNRCPSVARFPPNRLGRPVLMGHHTPREASGMYCVSAPGEPYCQHTSGSRGHPLCCNN